MILKVGANLLHIQLVDSWIQDTQFPILISPILKLDDTHLFDFKFEYKPYHMEGRVKI